MSTMTPDEVRAVLTVSVMAAFADGRKHEREREELRRIADGLAQDDAVHLPTLVQDVLTGRMTLAGVAPRLAGDNARHLAYEMAVCVCDADGAQSEAERGFLRSLAQALRLDSGETDPISTQAEALAAAPMTSAPPAAAPLAAAGAVASVAAMPAPGSVIANVDDATLDRMILNAAILNGAIELLPESLSTLAIIPLQMRLVYRIGAAHGYELDSGHIRDFLATVGVGLTSQYLEQAGRKLLGGLLGRIGGGGLVAGVGKQAVSSGMSFVTTYALGHVSKRYYAAGRQWSTAMLKQAYQDMTRQAQGLHQRHLPEIRERARGLDTGKVLALVRG